jgi:hypothetical protein
LWETRYFSYPMAQKAVKNTIPEDRIQLYEKLIQTQPDVERKGASMPYTSCNGHMFSFLSPAGALFLRLPEKEKENFIKKYKSSAAKQHGNVLMEYVEVPDKLLKDFAEMKKYFALSSAYAKTLKPKDGVS